jgi:probable addiction module antidote protein
MPKTRSYHNDLMLSLQDPAEAAAYLNASLAEGYDVFFLALKDVAEATGGMSHLAKATGRSRESLYKTLSTNANPHFVGIGTIMDRLGYQMTVTPKPQMTGL